MYYIVGLGNPGDKYADTRHNVGWTVLEHFMKTNGFPGMVGSKKYAGEISEGVLQNEEVTVLFPHTYMNKSGSAVVKLLPGKKDTRKLIVVYDDVDLPVGEVRVSLGRGSGGHNGVESVIRALGTKDFIRVRVGIASKGFFGGVKRPKGERLSAHVLSGFTNRERRVLEGAIEKATGALLEIITHGVECAMNRYN